MSNPTAPIYVGALVRLTVNFNDTVSGLPVDPDTAQVTVRKPDLTEQTQTLIKDGVGAYHFDQNIDQAGVWSYRGVGTGNHQAAAQDTFTVQPDPF